MIDRVVIEGEISLVSQIDGDCGLILPSDGEDGVVYEVSAQTHDTYAGAYEWTPSAEAQVIPIADMIAAQDITINPVPNNYGLITWNGSTITVS